MAGGAVGTLLRYLATLGWFQVFPKYPAGTFFVNLTGSFLIGYLTMRLTTQGLMPPELRLLLISGFLGGYTTFSSFELEVLDQTHHGRHSIAITYAFASVILGFAAVWIGAWIGRR